MDVDLRISGYLSIRIHALDLLESSISRAVGLVDFVGYTRKISSPPQAVGRSVGIIRPAVTPSYIPLFATTLKGGHQKITVTRMLII